VDYVAQTISPLGGSLHLVGHSLGAAVAVALSELGNIDIRSMSLLSPAGMGAGINAQFIDGFLGAKSEVALKTWMQSLVCDPDDMAPVLVRATLKSRSEADLVGSQRELARGLFENGTQLFSIVNGLRRFNGAASVVIGTDDAIVQSSDVIARTPPHAALYKLSGIGHLPQIECPSLVNTIVARTVKSAS
jgi:pyruvate dehydrogenase E2 component (dihydrolipoamide acetyltransferase)